MPFPTATGAKSRPSSAPNSLTSRASDRRCSQSGQFARLYKDGGVRFGVSCASLAPIWQSPVNLVDQGIANYGNLGATVLVLLAATCISVGTAIGQRYPLSRAASKAAVAGWGMGIIIILGGFCLPGSVLIAVRQKGGAPVVKPGEASISPKRLVPGRGAPDGAPQECANTDRENFFFRFSLTKPGSTG